MNSVGNIVLQLQSWCLSCMGMKFPEPTIILFFLLSEQWRNYPRLLCLELLPLTHSPFCATFHPGFLGLVSNASRQNARSWQITCKICLSTSFGKIWCAIIYYLRVYCSFLAKSEGVTTSALLAGLLERNDALGGSKEAEKDIKAVAATSYAGKRTLCLWFVPQKLT